MSSQDAADRPRHAPVQPGAADRFFDTAVHQVWALDRDTRAWLYLPDGAADLPVSTKPGALTWKKRCHAGELMCPYPACGVAFATARGGRRRHSFAHPAGVPDHSSPGARETWWHLNAKHTMAAWARTAFPGAQVRVDDIQLAVGDQRRQPDVLVVLRDGRRLAVELQYSALTALEWTARHDFYRSCGIVDVWLFAHTGPQFKLNTSGGRQSVRLLPVHQAMLRAGVVPMWFNPVWARLATAHTWRTPYLPGLSGRRASRAYDLPPLATFDQCRIKADDLDRCRLDWAAGELLTPTRRRHRKGQAALDEEGASAKAALAQQAAAEAAARPTRQATVPAADVTAPPPPRTASPATTSPEPAAPIPARRPPPSPVSPPGGPPPTVVAAPSADRPPRQRWWQRIMATLTGRGRNARR